MKMKNIRICLAWERRVKNAKNFANDTKFILKLGTFVKDLCTYYKKPNIIKHQRNLISSYTELAYGQKDRKIKYWYLKGSKIIKK